jgi:predicted membrane protein (TIGR00267 family)
MAHGPLRTKLKEYSEITKVGPILRRYFIIGAFDGALTVLGIILGAAAVHAGEEHKSLVLAMSFSAAIALSISSLVGAYEAERVERKINQTTLEHAMLAELGETHRQAFRFASAASAAVHGVAPLIASLVPVLPFLFVSFVDAVWFSIAITLAVLFAMGAYMGRMAKEHMIFSGLRFVAAGLVTAIILWLVGATR